MAPQSPRLHIPRGSGRSVPAFVCYRHPQECISKQMQNSVVYKEYIAILEGSIFPREGVIDASISRKEGSIIDRCINKNGLNAITTYSVIKEKNNLSLVKFILETDTTHQIRVHSKYIGHPILGDTLYGNKSDLINRQALHCHKISFIHPITNKKLLIKSPVPEDMDIIFKRK